MSLVVPRLVLHRGRNCDSVTLWICSEVKICMSVALPGFQDPREGISLFSGCLWSPCPAPEHRYSMPLVGWFQTTTLPWVPWGQGKRQGGEGRDRREGKGKEERRFSFTGKCPQMTPAQDAVSQGNALTSLPIHSPSHAGSQTSILRRCLGGRE